MGVLLPDKNSERTKSCVVKKSEKIDVSQQTFTWKSLFFACFLPKRPFLEFKKGWEKLSVYTYFLIIFYLTKVDFFSFSKCHLGGITTERGVLEDDENATRIKALLLEEEGVRVNSPIMRVSFRVYVCYSQITEHHKSLWFLR